MAQKTQNKKIASDIKTFRKNVTNLLDRGFHYLGMSNVTEIPISSSGTSEEMISSNQIGNGIQGAFNMFDYEKPDPIPVDKVGTEGLGYIPWGPQNAMPNLIYSLVAALPYTAAPIKYIVDLTVGLGPHLMYRWTRYVGGTVKTELIPFKDAGVLILNRIREIRAEIKEQEAAEGSGGSVLFGEALKKTQEPEPGTLQYELNELLDDYESWKTTDKEWDDFCESNNLNLHYLKCMTDDIHMDIYYPTIGLSIGRNDEEWNPKIVKIGILPCVCCRMEEMNRRMQIKHVYYSEEWRKNNTPKVEDKKIVAIPTLMPENMLPELRRRVKEDKDKRVKKRTTWYCCPNYYPSMMKPYYPQPAWWSIFPSRAYDYASILITDKAIARKNSTMWGKMIFINNEYLQAVCSDEGADSVEKQKEIRQKIYKDVNAFLKQRENNGKTICLDSFTGPDGKTLQHAVEIVDVPYISNSREMKDELEEISSIIFFAIGAHPALIGAIPGKSSSTGGTYQRELQLLKQNQVSPRQRIYLHFLQSIYKFNQWDKHGEIVIRQQVLTTLDRNATGVEETQSQL